MDPRKSLNPFVQLIFGLMVLGMPVEGFSAQGLKTPSQMMKSRWSTPEGIVRRMNEHLTRKALQIEELQRQVSVARAEREVVRQARFDLLKGDGKSRLGHLQETIFESGIFPTDLPESDLNLIRSHLLYLQKNAELSIKELELEKAYQAFSLQVERYKTMVPAVLLKSASGFRSAAKLSAFTKSTEDLRFTAGPWRETVEEVRPLLRWFAIEGLPEDLQITSPQVKTFIEETWKPAE